MWPRSVQPRAESFLLVFPISMEALRLAAVGSVIGLVVLMTAGQAGAATGACGGVKGPIRTAGIIHGGRGNDVLIGSGRSQTILAGAGNDIVCAGGGNDTVHGQGGNDTIHGEGRGDSLFGDGGADRLYGDILDDKLMGGTGADALIGGHGVDRMFGGAGNDLLRGGTNRDCYYGDGGVDTASFASAMPGSSGPVTVSVDLSAPVPRGHECPRPGTGRAFGDGFGEALPSGETPGEPLTSIGFIVGSAFDDVIFAAGVAGVEAGLGQDQCIAATSAAGCGSVEEKPPGLFAYVFDPATGAPADPGLIIRGEGGPETIGIAAAGAGARVTSSTPLMAGPGCDADGNCSARRPLGHIAIWGDGGADTISIGEGQTPDVTVDADGGPGDDTLTGSSLGEVLYGGEGADTIQAKAGGDALISEGGSAAAGPDLLAAGKGDDQVVADYPCAGHTMIGGPGYDIAGFARSRIPIRARIGGPVTHLEGTCVTGRAGAIRPDFEVLEGSQHNRGDILIGSARGETIWGRGGGDTIIGRGGADTLLGFTGPDLILARDGHRDLLLSCGAGDDPKARRDRIDPPAIGC
jgi:Ca2+-binding RTX toxin-like protein